MTEAELLEEIKKQAIALWGDRWWKSELTHAYYPIALGWDSPRISQGEFRNHRPTIQRAYDGMSGTRTATLTMLAKAAKLKITIEPLED